MDYVTTLTTRRRDLKATKTIVREADGSITKHGYGRAGTFTHYTHPVNDLSQLHFLLHSLQNQSNTFVVRGKVADNAPAVIRRRMYGEEAYLYEDPAGHHWLHLDIDGQPFPEGMSIETAKSNPQAVCEHVLSVLPAYLHESRYVYQFSSSMGLSEEGGIRLHLWFWMSKKFTDNQLREWCHRVNDHLGSKYLDPQVCVTVQPNYVAAPVFVNMPDPMPSRVGIIEKRKNEVVMPETPELLAFTGGTQ